MNWLQSAIEFFSLSDANVRYVLFGVILLSASTSLVGSFTFLRKKALVGDAIAHAVLPGICVAFMLFETKNPLILLAGAAATGWFSTVCIDYISDKTRIKSDTAIALTLSLFFGIGIFLLTVIQKSGSAAQSGLDHYLFGQAAALIGKDVILLGAVAAIIIVVVLVFFKSFALIAFDEEYAKSLGEPVRFYEFLLSTLTVLAIAVGIQAVGVVLMAAMLITPAAAARYWTNDIKIMVALSVLFGVLASTIGAFVSYTAPKMPTGPWIIVAITFIVFISLLFAPKRGLLQKWYRKRNAENQVLSENILKALFHLGEVDKDFFKARSTEEILNRRSFKKENLQKGLKVLDNQDFIDFEDGKYKLSEAGRTEGARIARLHRLWELYLNTFLKIPEDHVHESAEIIEHLITPEIEDQLIAELGNPKVDPHNREIPF